MHNGEQRIHTLQRVAFDRHAEDRQAGEGGDHTGQVGGPAGPGDNDFQAPFPRAFGIGVEPVGRAMGRNDARFQSHIEGAQSFSGMAQSGPVALTAHDNADRRRAAH
ncbi:hypothetical protein VZ95_18170 [Elstera litoralis]|uniref:Uncharacterized protein n=1 Tax=Elstera litoralis TaxID=552518 RepID=A0A0F3IP34_9PROT|nr:hypothetical protein VZ95_18170 [Elstera litoralis]